MAQYRFLYNLNEGTYQAREKRLVDPAGYLLSIHRYTDKLVNFALSLNREHDEIIMADNGFFRRISEVVERFSSESRELLQEVSNAEKNLGHKARPGDLPTDLVDRYRLLAKRARTAVYALETGHPLDFSAVLSEQEKIQPDRLVCPEDILQASLVGLNIEPEYSRLPRQFYRYSNQRSARFFGMAQRHSTAGDKYAVASAVDFNTAYDAGREMAAAGARYLALGTGAYMADPYSTDHYRIHRRQIVLESPLPRRYLRTVLTISGLLEGYRAQARTSPERLHLLGLGTPIMMLMAAWIGRDLDEVSFDATSPIKDAVEGTLYVTEPSYLKLKTRKLAEFYARNPSQNWDCDCAYCKYYSARYPMNAGAAGSGWETHRPEALAREQLAEDSPLGKALPLFSEPSGGEVLADVSDWRIGHNHMILERVMRDLNEQKTHQELRTFVEGKIQKYQRHSLPHYGLAVQNAWELTTSGA